MESLPSSPRKRLRLECGPSQYQTNILDLDDASLQDIFSLLTPLPDLFHVARTCRRFRDVATTRRNWLLVEHADCPSSQPRFGGEREGIYRERFTCLQDAVRHSRPGDTILLAPGLQCHIADAMVLTHSVRIMGGGDSPEDCVLSLSSASPAPVLTFEASSLVSNISIFGDVGGCIAHTSGRLLVEDCILNCNARGLYHLASPVDFLAKRSRTCSRPAARLVVAATSCAGGSSAVRLSQDGRLHNVRVVYEKSKFLFWFEVSLQNGQSDGFGRLEQQCSETDSDLQPSWVAGQGIVKFDVAALKCKANTFKTMATS